MAYVHRHHSYRMGRKLASSLEVVPCSSIVEVAASVVASTGEASIEEACSCLAIVECTLVAVAFQVAAGFVRRLLDLRVLRQVACLVAHHYYCFLDYKVLVTRGYTVASGIRLETVRYPWDRGGPSYHSRR